MSFNEWKYVKVKDIAEIIFSGGTPSTQKAEFWNGKINWLSSGETRSKFIYNTEKKITQEGVDNSSTKLAKKKDIVIASAGQGFTRGQTSMCLIDTYINQSLICIRAKKDVIDPYYLFYNISSRYAELRQISDGHSIRGSLTTKIISDLNISLPIIKEQIKIGETLFAIDEKIETNNEINKKLEEMAQAIFKQWFVDFEFPNEDGKPYKSSGGEMVESELGMIPKYWGVDLLSNLVKEVITGKTPSTKKSENYGDKYPFVTIPDMHNKVFVTKTERYLSEDGHKLQEKKLIPKNSIMVSCIATVGLVSISSEAVHTNQQINSIIPNSIEEVFYFYEYLKLMEDRLKGIGSSGSATLNVNKGEFEKIKYIYPDSRIINKYNNTVKNIYEKIKLNEIENNRLAQLRDTLLPKLMSGEIRVPID
ncbi:restriction endonuclease subunit S [Clostridium sp. K04]|uniref:restriction endonuclease subunit S n=1 Tax=Clostridium sp. K04 TaxID=2718929 RepID=UPI001C8CB2F9|nr:restriction endonuclease subunit S [Clostridium sp. K04]MBX9184563.1 restriction endonuclease subunit S [Clostridium sp. K04]